MKTDKNVHPAFSNEPPKDQEFYNIPLIGEVHVENEFGSGGNYNIGELIKNFRKNETRFINLRAMDEGLVADGILNGDFLTVNLMSNVQNGDIAAVRLGNKIFIRKVFYERDLVRLDTSSENQSPLIIDSNTPGFSILGKVSTVIREL